MTAPVDLDAAADELYALGPADLDRFAPRRNELAAAARKAGDRELAGRISALRKPVQAAALANALVRQRPAEVRALSELAGRLRDAHRHLRGGELRELAEQRQRWLAELAGLAAELAGRPVGETVLGQLRETFEAAIADEAAEQAVLSGRLTGALSYAGFGEVDIGDAVATPPPRLRAVPDLADAGGRSGSGSRSTAAGGSDSGPEPVDNAARRRIEQALQRADAAAEAAEAAVADAADELAEADSAERAANARVEQLEQELDQARREATAAAKAAVAAGREHARRVRAYERADQARQLAESELDELLEGG
ncbi:MAG TPA: hypothetical protein VFD94_03855 [Jatrophihabitans sp.]|nr:hypothetical protein [Jatrophihabitans sp.]